MSKNSAIEIILRVRPHKNVYKDFSNNTSMQRSTGKRTELNFSYLRKARMDILTINKKNDPSSLTRFLTSTPGKRKSLIKWPKMSLILPSKASTGPFSRMGRLEAVKLSR